MHGIEVSVGKLVGKLDKLVFLFSLLVLIYFLIFSFTFENSSVLVLSSFFAIHPFRPSKLPIIEVY